MNRPFDDQTQPRIRLESESIIFVLERCESGEWTLEEIRGIGLDALRRSLGPVGMIRFLQQFEHGNSDYARERREWVDQTSMEELERLLAEYRRNKAAPKKRAARSRRSG